MKFSFLLLIAYCLLPIFSVAQTKAEVRGVWVATVENIDWPSRGNYNSDSQKVEFIRLLDMHQRNGMNAMIVQIRHVTDAFYPSQFEPWSEYLTGKQGQPPMPYYDPL
ncbi:MAG: family 10 glycosylhydrolase, partial [Ferruginibacter sp.]